MYVTMMQSSSAVLFLIFLSSPSIIVFSFSLDANLIMPIPSEYTVPTTGTTSWMINKLPSFWLNGTDPYEVFNPILQSNSSSSGSHFSCGFSCQYYNMTSCFFGTILFKLYGSSVIEMKDTAIVWSAKRNDIPLQGNATLKFTSKGDLLLANEKGNLVWSTNTSGKSVLGLKLTELGNLVLFGYDHSILWQSFDYPIDTLVRGQNFFAGHKLKAYQGLYSLTHESSIVAYIDSNPPQAYYNSSLDPRYETYEWWRNIQEQNVSLNLTYDFSKLESNGHFNIYRYEPSGLEIMIDLFKDQVDDCAYPMACGRYGLCSRSNQCSCPEEVKNGTAILRPLDYRIPELGCTLLTNISCDDNQYHSLVELKNTTYFNFYQRQGNVDISLNDCKLACLRNCSCKALVYSYTYNEYYYYEKPVGKVYPCLLLNEVFSLKALDKDIMSSWNNISVFLKVQEISKEQIIKSTATLVATIIGTIISIFLLGVFFLLYNRRKMVKDKVEHHLPQLSGLPTRYSYDHLKSITSNFSKKLGEGGFGSVFEGTLSNGLKVAVKCLNGFDQLKKSFLAEVETIGNIHHVNLVKLIGYCAEESYTLLVYEYMPNGSLDKWIFYEPRKATLNWELRKKIIIDIAKGLAYLHEDCRQKILHLDIKPQNILLDENFNAKISDFGLAKLVEKDHSQIITTLRGTPGYIAPEWLSLNITEKVDVYSFGVVVMEILCGRPNLDRYQSEDNKHLLGMFTRKGEEGKLHDLINKSDLELQSNMEEIVKIMKLAAWCLQSDFSRRPSMTSVVKVLECTIEVENNLDYNFINHPIAKVTKDPDVVLGVTAPLPPSILSGPR